MIHAGYFFSGRFRLFWRGSWLGRRWSGCWGCCDRIENIYRLFFVFCRRVNFLFFTVLWFCRFVWLLIDLICLICWVRYVFDPFCIFSSTWGCTIFVFFLWGMNFRVGMIVCWWLFWRLGVRLWWDFFFVCVWCVWRRSLSYRWWLLYLFDILLTILFLCHH